MSGAGILPQGAAPEAGGAGTGMLARMRSAAAPLVWTGLALLLVSVPTLMLSWIDARTLHGVSVWIKPWKFQVSTGSYLLTLAWVMVWLPPSWRSAWSGRYVAWVAIASALFEVAYISWQAAWGRASHFNVATPYDATMYALMGAGALLLTSTALVLGLAVLRSHRFGLSNGLRHAVGWGLVLTFLLGTGFGGYLSSQSGHWVGAGATDAGGMWFTTWSRSGGDLRVAHFFGIHAVHFLVAWAWVMERALRWRAGLSQGSEQDLLPQLVWVSGLLYSAFSLWTFRQALGGAPFLG